MENIYNFRDFGGYKSLDGSIIKKGMLYRCASLSKASKNDLKELAALGIRTICDLRSLQEKKKNPDRLPNNLAIKSIHIPIKATQNDEATFFEQFSSLFADKTRKINFFEYMEKLYREYVNEFKFEFSKILSLSADKENLPILIHCTAGKDRTGLACSLIQMALGVPIESVIQDYLLTNDYLRGFKKKKLRQLKVFSLIGVSNQNFIPLFDARTEYFQRAMDQIEYEFGTVENYIQDGLGFTLADRLRLNELLLEKKD
jgi:protein-tyrosine phosphatase